MKDAPGIVVSNGTPDREVRTQKRDEGVPKGRFHRTKKKKKKKKNNCKSGKTDLPAVGGWQEGENLETNGKKIGGEEPQLEVRITSVGADKSSERIRRGLIEGVGENEIPNL